MLQTSYDEIRSFELLRPCLRADLVSAHGFSNPDAGLILNWFNPANAEYLEHVDAWQKCLCQGASPDRTFPLQRHNAFGNYDIFHLPTHQIGAIHQVAKLVYKWHGDPRRKTNMEEVKQRLSQPLPITLKDFELEGVRRCLNSIVPPDLNECVGRFGPGSTYEGFRSYEKWKRCGLIPDVPPNLYRANPRDPWVPTGLDLEGTTRIAEVPKSIKVNRIVSSEPAMRMYAQLAVNDHIVDQLHERFKGHVSLFDQERHNKFLLIHDACSVDLKDASDHVSWELVQAVLPQLSPVLAKVRSSYTLFPDGDRVRLATFAPMGSGVCFSVMTLVILGICEYLARLIAKETGRKPWYSVYGDDVIIPVVMFDLFIDFVTRAGLLVNRDKSCCTLVYRESCGREMYFAEDITPAYLRDPITGLPASKVEQVCSALQARSFERTAAFIADTAEAVSMMRFNRNLQRMELCVRTISARQRVRSLDGYAGLNRWFAIRSQQSVTIADGCKVRLQPQGVAQEVWTKPAWRYKACWDFPYLWSWFATRLDEIQDERHKALILFASAFGRVKKEHLREVTSLARVLSRTGELPVTK